MFLLLAAGASVVLAPEEAFPHRLPLPAAALVLCGMALSLVGDVLLLRERLFTAGLTVFLVAHLAYTAAFVLMALKSARLLGPTSVAAGAVAGAAVVASAVVVVGRTILAGAERRGERGPVAAYLAAISVMVVAAGASGHAWAAVGAGLFYASDTLLAWRRYVGQWAGAMFRWREWHVMATYHVAQFCFLAVLAFG
jgi:alkenylglycerophosphocholine/alkenylglycerophosphoethanolamine hydrolase